MNKRLAAFYSGTNVFGWIARLWSLLLLVFMVLRLLTPDPYVVAPVPLEDWLLLSFWGLAVFSLMLAWRWPRLGAWLAIGIMALREVVWVVVKGGWLVNFLIIWLAVMPPAVFYLVAAGTKNGLAGSAADSSADG